MPDQALSVDLGVLDAPQRVVWAELDQVPACFTLYGGTAIVLRLGHRQSIDFALFAFRAIDPRARRNDIPFLASAETILQDVNTLTVLLDRGGPVQVSFFGLPRLRRVRVPQRVRARALVVASLLDLAATNVEVIQARAERKDYLDIDALLTLAKLALPDMLGQRWRCSASSSPPRFHSTRCRTSLTCLVMYLPLCRRVWHMRRAAWTLTCCRRLHRSPNPIHASAADPR